MSLTLHYQRPIDEKTPFPYRAWEGDTEIEAGYFHSAMGDFDTWEAWACNFDNIVSFQSLVAHTEPHVEKGKHV